jgi:hypothetical protein
VEDMQLQLGGKKSANNEEELFPLKAVKILHS